LTEKHLHKSSPQFETEIGREKPVDDYLANFVLRIAFIYKASNPNKFVHIINPNIQAERAILFRI
jgi:hypothetical protein